jgi:hypothetical protein
MGFFDSIFSNTQLSSNKTDGDPVQFGHFSDNNKTQAQLAAWAKAEGQFHDGKYISCAEGLLAYIQNEGSNNVQSTRSGNNLSFTIIQGSKRIHGTCSQEGLKAWCPIATMVQPSNPAMRKLLELNYTMSYSRFALREDILQIIMDCSTDMMHPNKLYFGLRELALQADLQDDLLLGTFSNMQQIDSEHVLQNSALHKEVKYNFFVASIQEVLLLAQILNPDTYSGGMSYMFMNLLQKLHYLLVPEGRLLEEIDQISTQYWGDIEKKTTVELNQRLQRQLGELLSLPKEMVTDNLFYTNATFCRMPPPDINKVQEVIAACLHAMQFYRDNNQPQIANMVMMYSITNAAYHNSLPQCLRKLIAIYMRTNHADFCAELGITDTLYNPTQNTFSKTQIANLAKQALDSDRHRFPHIKFDVTMLNYTNLVAFNQSFLEQLLLINYNS